MSMYKFMRHVRVVKKQLAILLGLDGLSFMSACGLIVSAMLVSIICWFTLVLLFSIA